MKSSRHALTLVELMVVILILAVLLTILLPSISSCSSCAATRVFCANNMAAFSKAIVGYAQAHHGKLPPTWTGSGSATSQLTADPKKVPWNVLYTEGFLPNTAKGLDTYTFDPAGNASTAGYAWNPHPADPDAPFPGSPAAPFFNWPNAEPRWQTLSAIPKDRALGSDMIGGAQPTIHNSPANSRNQFWNLAYPDGSVKTIAAPFIAVQMQKVHGQAGPFKLQWTEFNDYLRVLELMATGKNPKLAQGQRYYWETGQKNMYYPCALPNAPADN